MWAGTLVRGNPVRPPTRPLAIAETSEQGACSHPSVFSMYQTALFHLLLIHNSLNREILRNELKFLSICPSLEKYLIDMLKPPKTIFMGVGLSANILQKNL